MSDRDTTSGTIRKPDVGQGYCAAAADSLQCRIGRPCEPATLGETRLTCSKAQNTSRLRRPCTDGCPCRAITA